MLKTQAKRQDKQSLV